MIGLVMQDFMDRVEEVERFFRLLRDLERPQAQLTFAGAGRSRNKDVDGEWIKTLKAAAFLILYNLVEASMRRGIGAVYETIEQEGQKYTTLRQELQDVWVEQQYRRIEARSASLRSYEDKAKALISHVVDQLVLELDHQKLPGAGGLDADRVRGICRSHGIPVRTHPRALGGGELLTVMRQRNYLAHGDLSFRECGRQFTIQQLEAIKKQVVVFMRSILQNIDRYISQRAYTS